MDTLFRWTLQQILVRSPLDRYRILRMALIWRSTRHVSHAMATLVVVLVLLCMVLPVRTVRLHQINRVFE